MATVVAPSSSVGASLIVASKGAVTGGNSAEEGKELNSIVFESFSHTGTILKGLNELRIKGVLVDVALRADEKIFRAHRAVLSACSEYFRAMFSSHTRESRLSEINLSNVSPLGIELLLDYIYTAKLTLNLANIQEVLSAASYIQLESVVEACLNYLDQQLDLDNYIDVLIISEMYSLKRLNHKVYRFICHHLNVISKSAEFFRLSERQIELILAGDYPVTCTEIEVLGILLRWIQVNCDEPRCDPAANYRQLIRNHIRFMDISLQELYNLLCSDEFQFRWIDRYELYDFIMKIGEQQCIKYKISPLNKIQNYRGLELAIIKIGGFDLSGITNEITYCFPGSSCPNQVGKIKLIRNRSLGEASSSQTAVPNERGSKVAPLTSSLATKRKDVKLNGKWRYLTTIPHIKQSNFGVVVLNNHLYVIGGCYDISLEEYIHPFGFRYCPIKNKWETIAPLQQDRCRFSLNVVGHSLIAVGGNSEMDDDGDRSVSTCEQYDPIADKWTYIESLPEYRTQHAGAAFGATLYVSGGLDLYSGVLGTLWSYYSFNEKWEKLANMLHPRADHVMFTINRKLYVCGGWYEVNGQRVLADSIDCYDLFSKSPAWHRVTQIPTPKYHAGIVAVQEKIYIIGGFGSDDIFRHTAASIECYNVAEDRWYSLKKYPKNVWEHTCANLYIPKYRDDMEVIDDNGGDDDDDDDEDDEDDDEEEEKNDRDDVLDDESDNANSSAI
ncbi:kelch-like protein 26 [Wyeomyia smithii]|uniref:kelch-like protein 26 n=1 Tax=Wyeomyia smithii TaxID=174621 RepID=UPI00246803A6|nr:kelch-like protein 26 [Wyeomyia smithii]XP_055540242.1 kelch-like protein 26 [Wyeomyia smithii]XP_055540249.1 kelch-like protein 26 [Wyeomyia smithii]XP_055540259.1 kelch-like protein 26 [Wyeomyia smithii]